MELGNDNRFSDTEWMRGGDVVALAVVECDAVIDWSDEAHSAPALWLPENLFDALAEHSSLRQLNIYQQSRLDLPQVKALSSEMSALEQSAGHPDVRQAAALVRERLDEVLRLGPGHVLLVEGP